MKQVTSAILLLVASTLAAAVEPVSGTNQSLVMAYNDSSVTNTSSYEGEIQETISKADAKRVLEKTLDVVSANLTVELDTPFDAMFVAK